VWHNFYLSLSHSDVALCLLVLLLGPLSYLASPTPSSATYLHLPPHEYCSNGTVTKKKKKKTEMQKKKKKQETDRRYRQKKKVNI